MNNLTPRSTLRHWRQRALDATRVLVLGFSLGFVLSAGATTKLADQPLFSANDVPGNLALAMSVEWPTADRTAYPGGDNSYSVTTVYLGYFDPRKCYDYVHVATETATDVSHFVPVGIATNGACTGSNDLLWSGNFLNWATTQTIDPFRWAMTGGYRIVDEVGRTILQKARQDGQGLFPDRSLTNASVIAGATPFAWNLFRIGMNGRQLNMVFSGAAPPFGTVPTDFISSSTADPALTHQLKVRVRVCDPSLAHGGVESNCEQYGSNYKPEGLIQRYSDRMRFSAFGYLNQSAPANARDGGVMRARMKFTGPMQPIPGKNPIENPSTEWDPKTGIFDTNPDKDDANNTNTEFKPTSSIVNSGVINYLNKFGQLNSNQYKSRDPVSEMYYSVLRYFKNQGAVAEHLPSFPLGSSDADRTRWLDDFPVISKWDDPILYACQKNFVLGIGDIYTHADKNLPGDGTGTTQEIAKPEQIKNDTTVNSVTATDKVFALQGLGLPNRNDYSGRNNSAGMAGLAYMANTKDIRPDDSTKKQTEGKQTVQTFWVDVLEAPFVANNQFYLTAKYGGFTMPENFNPDTRSIALPKQWWSTSGETVGTQDRPDNYFAAGQPATMIAGLQRAFARIDSLQKAYTTSFSTSLPQVANSGNKSYSAEYDAKFWTGELKASELSFTGEGEPSLSFKWRATDTLATQLAGTGWDLKRNVVSWDPATKSGVRFRAGGPGSLGAAQLATLDTMLHSADDRTQFLNYLRGDRRYEAGSTAVIPDEIPAETRKVYRPRERLLGDIVGSRAVPVAPPNLPMSDSYNPGYAAFKTLKKDRPTLLFAGANDGMLHAFNGTLEGTDAGKEIFAYVPSALFSGPDATPAISGLAALGDPNYAHRFYVNASPAVFDVDFAKTDGATGAADWRSVLVGGLGKGGRSYYALDVTDAHLLDTEAKVAASVLWEFSDPDLGYSFGEPSMVKTKAYGWTLIIPSGYNNPDGKGYIFLVNPKTGALLQKIGTGVGGGSLADAGLAHIEPFINDYADGHADAVYGGDLLGNLWRFDIRGTSFPAPQLLAELRDAGGNPQPVTSRPLIEVFPKTNIRFVKIGSGRLLSDQDIASGQEQTYYSIRDGNNATFTEAADLPAGVSFPLRRDADLLPNTDLFSGITAEPDAPMGWYFDLGVDAETKIAWRVVSDSDSFRNAVTFAPTLPNGNECQPSGSSRVYIVDFASGKTLVQDGSTVKAYWSNIAGVVTDLRFLSVGGQARLIGGSDSGEIRKVPGSFGSTLDFRRINWRELPTAN